MKKSPTWKSRTSVVRALNADGFYPAADDGTLQAACNDPRHGMQCSECGAKGMSGEGFAQSPYLIGSSYENDQGDRADVIYCKRCHHTEEI